MVSRGSREENMHAQEMLGGKHWDELQASGMQNIWNGGNISAILVHLTPAAFCYYLPFYMILALEEAETGSVETISDLINRLEPSPQLGRYLSHITPQQRAAIADFLVLATNAYKGRLIGKPLEEILENYWGQFATPQPEGG